MAFTEATLKAELDSVGNGMTINIVRYLPGATDTHAYVVGVCAPYAGKARWVRMTTSNSAADAAAEVVAALA